MYNSTLNCNNVRFLKKMNKYLYNSTILPTFILQNMFTFAKNIIKKIIFGSKNGS
jgi:hypothetical protein